MNRYIQTIVTRSNSDYNFQVDHFFYETNENEKTLVKHSLPNDWDIKEWAKQTKDRSFDFDREQKCKPRRLFNMLWKNRATRNRINYLVSGDDELQLIIVKKYKDEFTVPMGEADKRYLVTVVTEYPYTNCCVSNSFIQTACNAERVVRIFTPSGFNISEWATAERERCSYDFDESESLPPDELFSKIFKENGWVNVAMQGNYQHVVFVKQIQENFPQFIPFPSQTN